jgi:glyceraldehyde-3-phosphate dehydrogenase/erythrose-4-phosphate dehydrogenase
MISENENIYSAASWYFSNVLKQSTTNAIVPVLKAVDDKFGIDYGFYYYNNLVHVETVLIHEIKLGSFFYK